MKRTISLLVLIALALTLFVSCDDHEHDFSKKWSKDSDYHWHACSVENCSEKSDREEHDFEVVTDENGDRKNVCSVCGEENDKVPTAPEHEHVYAEEYSTSENFHWYACTVENCYEMNEREEHHYSSPEVSYSEKLITTKYVCDDCGYTYTDEIEVSTKVDDAMSWNEAFEGFELKNFDMYVYFGPHDNPENVNHCKIADDTVFYELGSGMVFYAQKNADGTYVTYFVDKENDRYVIDAEAGDLYFERAKVEPVLHISFADNFEKFTYDAELAAYVYDGVIEAEATYPNGSTVTLYCFNNKVVIANGEIVSIDAEYAFDMEKVGKEYYRFAYYDIGYTNFSIPKNVIDNAMTEEEFGENIGVRPEE